MRQIATDITSAHYFDSVTTNKQGVVDVVRAVLVSLDKSRRVCKNILGMFALCCSAAGTRSYTIAWYLELLVNIEENLKQ